MLLPACGELTQGSYCDKHRQEKKKQKQQSNRYYDKHLRGERATAFYNSREWRATRTSVLSRDRKRCQHCLIEKKITRATMVHHIAELKKDWIKRVDLDNLVSLCDSCHNKIDHYK